MVRSARIERLMQGLPLTAASFIVTVYGDLVAPRGEVLWMGSLIGVCRRVGISESLVRTATSRLVAAGRLEGARQGRRSFYRLAPTARAEFAAVARLLYAAAEEPARWLALLAPGLSEEEGRRLRMARLGGDLWILALRADEPPPPAVLTLAISEVSDPAALARFWDLEALQARYAALLTRFGPLAEDLAAGVSLSGGDALAARLLLAHVHRGALLRDPRLPAEALPADWLGAEAKAMFRSLYKALTPMAETEAARSLEGGAGPLPEATPQTQARLAALA